jgi:hypothetical protein
MTLISTLIDSTTLKPVPPSDERKQFFESTSGMPYDMPLVTNLSETLAISCPSCSQTNSLQWATVEGRGFGQPKFQHQCEHCKMVYTKASMGIKRFAEEVARKRAGETVYISYVPIVRTAGRIN